MRSLQKKGRKIILYAREEAEKRNSEFLDTEHLLLAILREEESIPVAIMRKIGIAPENVRYEIEKRVTNEGNLLTYGEIPFSPRAKKSS